MNLSRAHRLALSSLSLLAACAAPASPSGQPGDEKVATSSQAVISSLPNAFFGSDAGSAVVMSDGTVYTCGTNTFGQLGNGTTYPVTTITDTLIQVHGPDNVGYLSGITAISGSFPSSFYAITESQSLFAWGSGSDDQLGDSGGGGAHYPKPVQGQDGVGYLAGVTTVASSYGHTLAVTSDGVSANGTVWAWGLNDNGQLGNGSNAVYSIVTPANVLVSGGGTLSGAVAVTAGNQHSVALLSDGTVWAWGANGSGELGDGSGVSQYQAVQVHGINNVGYLTGVTAIAASNFATIALLSNGTVAAWGANGSGQLGDGTHTDRPTPVAVEMPAGVTFTAVAEGAMVSWALASDQTVWAWGQGGNGQLGNGTTASSSTPQHVQGVGGTGILSGITAIAPGWYHALAQGSDGTVYGWGENTYGQLGNATTAASQSTPVKMLLPCTTTAPTPDQCQLAAVCLPTGVWSLPDATDGTGCNDGNACTDSDVCTSGVCAGTPYTCGAPGQCQDAGTCNGDGTCSYANQADGTSCDDGNACTYDDQCTSGVCGGTAYTCSATSCEASSTCNGDGGCTVVDEPAGYSCGTGLVCDSDGACGSGCFIGDALYAPDERDTTNPCQVCTPATSTTSWSNLADGTDCATDDMFGTCQTGVCTE